MSDQLSQSDWDEFDSAIKDIRDTFFKIDIVISRFVENYSSFYGREKSDVTDKTDFNLKALAIYDKDSKSLNERNAFGNLDLSEGYLLIYYKDLVGANLVDLVNKKYTIDTTVDEVSFRGDNYTLIGGAEVGPFEDRFALVKLFFKRRVQNG
jgi:hypothetical protein